MTDVHISGLRELQRAFRDYNDDLKRELAGELRQAGDIVARAAPRLFPAAHVAPGAAGFLSRALSGSVVVRPAIRSKGVRGDFGSLIFRKVLFPTLQAKEPDIIVQVETMLDRIGTKEGF